MTITYRNLIISELERRKVINPSYSLRALARDIAITAPQLSAVLAGRKGISPKNAKAIASRLKLSSEEAEFFVSSAVALHARDKNHRREAELKLKMITSKKAFTAIAEQQFCVLNEWYYLSLLQAFELRDFEPSFEWLASRLGITVSEADSALRELGRSGLIRKNRGFYSPVKSFIKTSEVPSKQIRNHLQRMLKMSSTALEAQSIDERDFSSTVFPVDPSRINESKLWLRKFREKFCNDASSKGHPSEVYNLSIQFFRVSTPVLKSSFNTETI